MPSRVVMLILLTPFIRIQFTYSFYAAHGANKHKKWGKTGRGTATSRGTTNMQEIPNGLQEVLSRAPETVDERVSVTHSKTGATVFVSCKGEWE